MRRRGHASTRFTPRSPCCWLRSACSSELGRADESLRAARVLVDAALLHDAESRLYGRDFVLTEAALREDLASCQGFVDRARGTIAGILG